MPLSVSRWVHGWRLVHICLLAICLPTPWAALAAANDGQTKNSAGIYMCMDARGRKITSDRPIPDCLDREQQVLNKDGSRRHVLPPRQSLQERLKAEQAQREQERAAQAKQVAVRRDRLLMQRYPNEAAHQKARSKALDDVRDAMTSTQLRVKTLQRERKTLLAEAEFYKGKAVPMKLKADLEANDASQRAQEGIIANHLAEMNRVNAAFDEELLRLRQLWAGSPPGGGGK